MEVKAKGLKNLKNTCYINSAVQLLATIKPFVRDLLSIANYRKIERSDVQCKEHEILASFTNLLLCLVFEQGNFINPAEFVLSSYEMSKTFVPKTQQDSQEYINVLLEKLNFAMLDLEIENKELIKDTLLGKIRYTRACQICKRTNVEVQDFYTLGLPVPAERSGALSTPSYSSESFRKDLSSFLNLNPNSLTLFDSLSLFSKENKGLCHCQKCSCETLHIFKEEIDSISNYLIMYYKRFKYSMWDNKIRSQVYLPQCINGSEIGSSRSTSYKLVGVIEHSGFLFFGGHYTAYVMRQNTWYFINDKNARQSTFEEVIKAQAYIFLYEKVDPQPFEAIESSTIFAISDQ